MVWSGPKSLYGLCLYTPWRNTQTTVSTRSKFFYGNLSTTQMFILFSSIVPLFGLNCFCSNRLMTVKKEPVKLVFLSVPHINYIEVSLKSRLHSQVDDRHKDRTRGPSQCYTVPSRSFSTADETLKGKRRICRLQESSSRCGPYKSGLVASHPPVQRTSPSGVPVPYVRA